MKSNRLVLALIATQFLTVGCFKMGTLAQSRNQASVDPVGKYTFISVATINSTLTNQLQLPTGEPRELDPASGMPGASYTDKYAVELGEPDLARGVPANHSPDPMKSKLAVQIFADGCVLGLAKPEVQSRLFPKGVSDFSTFYLTFLGRLPDEKEKSILLDLVRRVDSKVAAAAACTAILNSIEFLNQS